MKNSNDTSWDRTSELPICSTAPYPLSYRDPLTYVYISYKRTIIFSGSQPAVYNLSSFVAVISFYWYKEYLLIITISHT